MKISIKTLSFLIVSSVFVLISSYNVEADEPIETIELCVGQTVSSRYSSTFCQIASEVSLDESIVSVSHGGTSMNFIDGIVQYNTTVHFTGVSVGTTTVKLQNGVVGLGSIDVIVKEHSWDSGVITKVPTESEKGIKTYVCTNCSKAKFEEVSTVSELDTVVDVEEIRKCINGGKVNSSSFELSAGIFEFSSPCTVMSSDESVGKITTIQGEMTSGDIISEHKYSYTLSFEPLKIGNTTVVVVDKDNNIVKTCNFIVTDHIGVVDKAVEPTCTKDGKTEGSHCSECGEILVKQEDIPAIGHKFTNYVSNNDATCTNDGTKTAKCDNGCKIKDTVTDEGTAKGHVIVADHTVEPTCTEAGKTEGIHCSECNEVIKKQEEIPAKGHVWDEGVIVTNPTALKDGMLTYTCSVCGETKQEIIPAKGLPKKGSIISDDFGTYKVTRSDAKNGTVEFVKSASSKTNITIPDTITINEIKYKVTSVSTNAFANNKKLTKVTIGSNIISIGKNAFSGCSKLTTVIIGKNVTTIGDNAFYKCTELKKITIPAKINKIGKQAFYICKKLKNITISSSKLTSKNIGSKAFGSIPTNAVIKVPKSKINAYTKLLISKGISKKATIKK